MLLMVEGRGSRVVLGCKVVRAMCGCVVCCVVGFVASSWEQRGQGRQAIDVLIDACFRAVKFENR